MTVPPILEVRAPEVDVESAVVKFIPLADWYANRIQWREEDHEDLVQEGLLELTKTLRGYNKSGREIRDLGALAGACFNAAMQWWYKKSDRTLNFVGFDGLTIPVDNMEYHFSQIWVDQYLEELERVHGAIARNIVQQLIAPDERVAGHALAAMEKKKEQHAEGKRVVGYASPRIQKQHIREAVQMDTKEWDRTLANIKVFTKEYLCRSRESVTGHSKKEFSEQRPNSGFPIQGFTTSLLS